MRFENPEMLYFLALPVVAAGLLFFGIWSRKRIIARFGKRQTVEGQLTRPSPYLRAAKGIAVVLGVTALVIAAARPQYGGRIRMLKKSGIDIVVALDFSKSMLAQDTPPSRIERAKLELKEFIEQLTGDRIGLVAFAGDTMRFPLTTDYAAATAFWRDLGPYDMPVGGTAIGKALTAAVRMLRSDNEADNQVLSSRSKAVVLITDGEDHIGDPLEAAKEAGEQGVVVHTVGIGSDSPELIPRVLEDGTVMGYQKMDSGEYVTTALTKENEAMLREIAAATSGHYFRAGRNFDGMNAVIKEIRKMKQSDIESRQQEVYEDVFQWFLIPAFALLLLAFALPERLTMLERRPRRATALRATLPLLFAGAQLIPGPASAEPPGLFMSENSDVKKGNVLMKEGNIGEALKAYESATRALPDRAAVHLNRGLALYRSGEDQLDQAMQAFKTATDTKGSDAVQARAHFNLGNAFFKKEDYVEAVRQYKRSLILEPGNKDAAWNLELATQKQKQKEAEQKENQEDKDQQDEQNQDEQNQDEQNQDEQNQDEQNQGEQNQDEQNQDEQNQDEQNQDEQNQDEQNQDEQNQDEQNQDPPKTKQEVEQLLNSLDNQDDNLQKQMAKQRAAGLPTMPRKDW